MTSIFDRQLQSLLDGFDALKVEYQRLCTRCATLEANIDTAKSRYARPTDICPPQIEPLNPLSSAALNKTVDFESLINSSKIVDAKHRDKIIVATRTTNLLRSASVAIHAGPSADRPSAPASSAMPSISESPLEQDFTVPGTPSKLGCPFASMQNRRLSAHAASVVSRYKPDAVNTSRTSGSRINGRASSSARGSIVDPIKAEVCAMDSPTKSRDVEASVQGSSTGVCPIRFLDQHSPEEVAAYFESHKHELPRSHELCVKRYQSNEEQIRQLDAKYGNIVSMIQGLGQKHVSLLPDKLAEEEYEAEHEFADEHASHEKIRQWASTVDTGPEVAAEAEEEERLPHFDRPLKDVRLGESPSRPWGIQVPIDAADRRKSDASSVAAVAGHPKSELQVDVQLEKPRGKCPFHFDSQKPPGQEAKTGPAAETMEAKPVVREVDTKPAVEVAKAAPVAAEEKVETRPVFIKAGELGEQKQQAQMVFTGPVFIGYSLQEAMSVLQSQKPQ